MSEKRILVGIAALGMLAASGCSLESTFGSADGKAALGVHERMRNAVPDGATRQDVVSWLTTEGFHWEYTSNVAEIPGVDANPGRYTGMIVAHVRGSDRPFGEARRLQVLFLFDPDDALERRVLKWTDSRA